MSSLGHDEAPTTNKWFLASVDHEIKTDERHVVELSANNLKLEADDISDARLQAEQGLELNIG